MNGVTTDELIRDTLATYFRNFVPFVLLTAVVLSPGLVLMYLASLDPSSVLFTLGAGLAVNVLAQIATGAICYGVFSDLRRRPVEVGSMLRTGLARLFQVILVSIATGIVISIGFLLLVVPGLIFATMFFVAVPAVVVENADVTVAINRSIDLTRGSRWPIFFLILFLGVIGLLVGLAGGGALSFLGRGFVFFQMTINVLLTAAQATAAGAVYYRLRERKEHINLDEIAEVFA